MSLKEYKRKRNFRATPEPKGEFSPKSGWLYVIQKHAASHLHYDFRLQVGDVLKSWAVPKGPSLNPSVKRLAMQVEDHPVDYGGFEGIIPEGNYGAGTVMLWDRGDWTPSEDPEAGFGKGRLKFTLNGEKLRGGWMLVRKGGTKEPDERHWFLMKERDEEASEEDEIVETAARSVLSDRTLDEIAAAKERVWKSNRHDDSDTANEKIKRTTKPSRNGTKASKATRQELRLDVSDGKKSSRLPTRIAPQLATLVDEPPDGDDWLHEIKFDGYRMICRISDGTAQFFSRNQQDWTDKLQQLAITAQSLPVTDAILDGEVVALDSDGISRFQLLQNAFRDDRQQSLHYYIFDLLHLNGRDLTSVPLERRKELLARLVGSAKGIKQLHLSEHVVGNGAEFFKQAQKMKLEGIVSKKMNGKYVSGRSHDWLKTKCYLREEFVIGGYTDPEGARDAFGALLIGYYDADRHLKYAGKVGTGFSHKTLTTVLETLQPLTTKQSPFADFPTGRGATRSIHWVKPQAVAQIEFSDWTDDGRLRHPAFTGLREDKPADEVVRDVPVSPAELQADSHESAWAGSNGSSRKSKKSAKNGRHPTKSVAPKKSGETRASKGSNVNSLSALQIEELSGVQLTHPDKVLYADQGITKLDVARYYVFVEKWILPHIENRLAVLVRCPEGTKKECFYQKHLGKNAPDFLRQVPVQEKTSRESYAVIENLSGLVWLAQAGVLELHVWGSRADDIERPDRLIFDLDPDPDLEWRRVAESAFQIREFLQGLGLESFLKTTGGKGLHLVVPIQRKLDWDDVKAFCHAVAISIETADPARYVSKMTKSARVGKIFVDYLRNQRGATAIAAYSTRSRAGATVSVPITWDELKQGTRSDTFNVQNLPDRLTSLKKDPWQEIFSIRQSITAAARKTLGLK